MITASLFVSLDSKSLADKIRSAQQSVCYAAPGVHLLPANALADVATRLGPEFVTVCIDFEESVIRMGFGDVESVSRLRKAGIKVVSSKGLRAGIVVIDDFGFSFTPIALYLESENQTSTCLNAMRLSQHQIREALSRLSPAAKAIAVAQAITEEEKRVINQQVIEVESLPIVDEVFDEIAKKLSDVPPAQFDLARQVRVFSAYMQYVELTLTGAAIQKHRLAIPKSIQSLGSGKELEGRLKTTIDLLERNEKLSSKNLENSLNEIRKDLTRSLGKNHGRVVLRAARPRLQKRLSELQKELNKHQEQMKDELEKRLNESRKQIVEYYLPRVLKNPPDAMTGQLLKFDESQAANWIDQELGSVFPNAKKLISNMRLGVRYKDVTFETLDEVGFLDEVKKAFPHINWDKAYQDFKAAGEIKPTKPLL